MVAVYPLHRFYSRKVGAIIGAEEMERCLGEELIGNIGADSECIATRTGNAQFMRIEAQPQFPFLVWRIHRFDFGIVRYADSFGEWHQNVETKMPSHVHKPTVWSCLCPSRSVLYGQRKVHVFPARMILSKQTTAA